jgi:hypothetical protein
LHKTRWGYYTNIQSLTFYLKWLKSQRPFKGGAVHQLVNISN